MEERAISRKFLVENGLELKNNQDSTKNFLRMAFFLQKLKTISKPHAFETKMQISLIIDHS